MHTQPKWLLTILFLATTSAASANEPWQPIARRLPPAGIAVDSVDREKLADDLAKLESRLAEARARDSDDEKRAALLIDVEIYAKALRFALDEGEFFGPRDVADAGELVEAANGRLDALAAGRHAWSGVRGLVARGYRSRVDGSVQPYGLVIPEKLDLSRPVALYVWLHGRNDKLADLQFIAQRQRDRGRIEVDDAIVLHPFGRSCLGWKSTAEIDVLEAIEAVSRNYPIDPDRVALLGFSMGGAGAWHMGAHYADCWAAVHAGAGFVDVARYQKLSPGDYPPPYEQKLWGLYDVPDYVGNLFNLPVVAYSGEIDKQKDAADFMAETYRRYDHELVHLIGPDMPHKYDPAVLADVLGRVHAAVEEGRNAAVPSVSLQTRTLRYNRIYWVEALGLDEHWRDSRIDAGYADDDRLAVSTKNIQSLRLRPPRPVARVSIDGQELPARGDGPLEFAKTGTTWQPAATSDAAQLRKRPGLQGPIDDVLLEPFLVVLPSGKTTPQVRSWVDFELDHFRRRWKNVYRGQLRVKRDTDVTADDCGQYHLIAWGDPASNSVVRQVIDKLPLRWAADELSLGARSFNARTHVPLMIYPNPLNPAKYIVLNSGPTHREAHDRTNSLQNPKLGDWAVIDIRVPPDAEHPGRVAAAGFFDETWQVAE